MPLSASIIIGTYNRREILLKTLASLDQQSAPSDLYEVVVVIDGSTDGTLESVSDLHTTYSLRAIYTKNQGNGAAYNLAAEHAKNDVLIIIGDDQICTPDLVLAHLRAHEGHERLFVQGFYPVAREYMKGGASLLYDRTYRSSMAEAERLQRQGKTWPIWGGNCSVRAETWREIGGVDTEHFAGYGCEDFDMGLRLAELGVAFRYEPRACSFHMHECSCQSLARQAYSEGRAEVVLSGKHDAALTSLTVSSAHSRVDSAVLWACRHRPRAMRAAGTAATAGLWCADQLPFESLQLLAARVSRKLHKARGTIAGLQQGAPSQKAPV
jgi:GT2 family glycosyltransferase